MRMESCPICFMEPEDGEDWYEPTCDKRHRHHYECMKQWSDKQKITNNPLFCTLCRAPIVFDEGTKRKLEVKNIENPVGAGDAFGLNGEAKGETEMVNLDAKNAAADANNPTMVYKNAIADANNPGL